MNNEFSPEFETSNELKTELCVADHHHATLGMVIIIIVLAIVMVATAGWSTSLANEGNAIQINGSYIFSRAIELAQFRVDEKPTTPEIQYLMPGAVGDQTVQLGNSTKKVFIFDPSLGIGGVAATFTAPEYEVKDASQTYTISNFKRVVGDILAQGGVELAKEDIVDPPRSVEPDSNNILITRVEVAEIQVHETLPYQTKKIDDPNLDRGRQIVSQKGKTGTKILTYRVRRENGVEVSRSLIKSEIDPKPQDEIIKIGTRVVVLSSRRGVATATNLAGAVVSANYKRGTLIRITNLANAVSIFKTVNYTWGTAQAPAGVVLDLSWEILDELKFNGQGAGPMVLVEEIKQ